MAYVETRTARIEWPTIGLIALVYGVLATLVWNHSVLPWWLLPIGAYFASLHASLQHEVLHGHPTRKRWLNELLVFVTPTFWLPYGRYRDTHLQHHHDIDLTDPARDPESYYLLPDDWANAGAVKRFFFHINHTLAGRMIIGPAVSIVRIWVSEIALVLKGDTYRRNEWALFAVSCVISFVLITVVAGMPFWKYYLLIAYPGLSLALVRSYCEHQAAANAQHRTIIVEAHPFWSLLFLNNNLHVAHHTKPALPWYKIPDYYAAEKDEMITRNNGYTMQGYSEIFRRFFFSAKEPIAYPDLGWLRRPGEN